MSIMQQSSKAQDRTLGVWFQQIQQGQIKLPRFQRLEAWDRGRVTSFLNTIINNLPVGVTLALEVAGKEKFISRYVSTAQPASVGAVTQHLLDGQQRLTAFWRSMHNNYDWETYFIHFPEFDRTRDVLSETTIRCEARWVNQKTGLRMPRWAEDSAQCLERGLVPLSLLRPEDISIEIEGWVKAACAPLKPKPDDADAFAKLEAFNDFQERLRSKIVTLRERVKFFNLPYLSLPAETEKSVALQVFINMNTNSKPLALYDIIVAEVESVNEESLHDREASIDEKCPHASRFGDIRDLILSTSALLQDQSPSHRGMIDMDKKILIDNWPKLERGLERMAAFLADQGIFDQARLPTNAVLAVIAASYEFIPDHGDFLAKSEKLLRRYLWSSFFTDRYENAAATRAFADFKAMKALLQNPQFLDDELPSVPVLNRSEFPLATADALMSVGWPKATGIRARAILAVSTYLGAYDFADNHGASYESVQKREYHHIFPDALLQEAGIESSLALNCALITWKTNRVIGRQDPLVYLQERIEWADAIAIAERLKSHLISFKLLSEAHYAGLHGEALRDKLAKDFDAFLRDRAGRIIAAMELLATGGSPSIEALWSSYVVAKESVDA
ncbi:DUF262 domain-containing protein [Rhodoblastus sp. 17X3]|uniref:DUF262 domain-containing protein n=1 Tax=Rhodoblastus sp. 17X3 TaxID=3047026 RepID=UPI0024B7EE0F|nr:DUF262 domain-containing protein [Rhodoblastus sp. 17X3]MDI9846727.1 DUF262 domain-containing protein [Rhodoblastus sp. 17X3]